MGLLQALIGYIRNSSKKLVQAIFGWAVQALFGTPKQSEETLLSAVVAFAAGWPLLLVGIAFPKAATFALTFIPIPKWVPSGIVRIGWIVAAALVPVAVGLVLARHGDVRVSGAEPFWKRAARGIPVTIAIGAAFVTAFLTAPLRRLIALWRRWEDEHLPLIIEEQDYVRTAALLREALRHSGLEVFPASPPWLLTAPSRVIRAIGGRFLRARLPENLCFYRGDELEIVVQPNGVTLQGASEIVARAHGILSEEATLTPGLQTTDAAAQELEKRLKDVYRVFRADPADHRGSRILLDAVHGIARDLEEAFVPYEQWQVLYREILQVRGAVRGLPQLLQNVEEDAMESKDLDAPDSRPLRSLSSGELLAETTREVGELVRQEVELAKAELRRDARKELAMLRSFGIAIVAGLVCLNMLCLAAVFWLSHVLTPVVSALAVAGVMLLAAAGFAWAGWAGRVTPLESTRKTLKDGWQWAKHRAA